MNEPQLPRRRKAPRRIEEWVSGTAQAEFPTTVEAHYRAVYYEALDLVTSCIKTLFDQEDYKIHSACESLLLKTATCENFTDELATVVQFYGSDFSRESLRTHLDILRTNYDGESQANIHDVFMSLFGSFHYSYRIYVFYTNKLQLAIVSNSDWNYISGIWYLMFSLQHAECHNFHFVILLIVILHV